jgi:predicted ABC-type ATPase
MKKLIIINGPMGVGKTTTGQSLCDKIGRAAFIDGDWCLDIHPFIGNKETKSMAIDNIIHMIKNYYNCSECDVIVLSWIISKKNIEKIIIGLKDINIKIYCITLICNEEELTERWKKDKIVSWRNNEWLIDSIKSIEDFKSRVDENVIDNGKMAINEVINKILEIII